jgi:hypothetical protein
MSVSGVPYYNIISCCPELGTQVTYFNIPGNPTIPNGIYTFIGTQTTINGITFKLGYCYTFEPVDDTLVAYPICPPLSDFIEVTVDECNNPECLECTEECSTFYTLTKCCDSEISFNFCANELLTGTTVKYTGPDLVIDGQTLESGQCYNWTPTSVIDPPYPSYTPISLIFNDLVEAEGCNDVANCDPCQPSWLVFYTCPIGSGPALFYTNTPNFEVAYPNAINFTDFIPEQYRDVCLNYESATCLGGDCTRPPSPLYDVDWTQTDKYTLYTDCDDCTFTCYKLVNCSDDEDFVYVNNNLSLQFENQEVIFWNDKCWKIEETETCENSITITFTETFDNCAICTNEKSNFYYELIDCNDDTVKIYTNTDLKDYVGQFITLTGYEDQCFYVEVFITLTPSNIPVIPTGDSFETCEECTLPRYKLTDCTGIKPDIVTNNDLESYVGDIVVLSTCPDTCWTVSTTEDNVPLVDVDILDPTFNTCPACLIATLPVQCVSFTLTSQTPVTVTLWLPNGQSTEVTLTTQEPTIKGCYLTWDYTGDVKVKIFGNCVDNQCPEIPKPKRKVTPGYDTPACTPEYYEKVECTFSEWMYKDALEKRYGISNCCPEELMKWEIKHEMLMLDSLINPDYTCAPPVNCGCPQPTTCNCSCNSGN